MSKQSVAALAVAGWLSASGAALAADVTITITGIAPGPGDLLVALQTEEEFLQEAGSYVLVMAADAETVSARLEDVVPGAYAVAVVHDEDGDGTFEVTETGPAEGWGISGMTIGEPTFDAAKVVVEEGQDNTASVTLSYAM